MKTSSSNNTIPSFIFDLFSLHVVFDLINNMSSFFLTWFSPVYSQFQLFGMVVDHEVKTTKMKINQNSDMGKKQLISSRESSSSSSLLLSSLSLIDDGCLYGEDINMVMENLGFEFSLEGEEAKKKWGVNEISEIFEEEPSLEEVKEAFGVFDQNRDGFIDARELQTVLCVLGLREGLELHACKKMISKFDVNEDGKLDLTEFVKFMLNTF